VYTRTKEGSILGCDFSGTVVASAASGARDHVKVGTRVAGWVHGNMYPDRGSFAEYLKVPADMAFVVPDNITQEQAATYGIPYFTAFHGLVHSQKKDWPPQQHKGWVSDVAAWTQLGRHILTAGTGVRRLDLGRLLRDPARQAPGLQGRDGVLAAQL